MIWLYRHWFVFHCTHPKGCKRCSWCGKGFEFGNKIFMKIIWWKASALILCWVLLAIFLTLINHELDKRHIAINPVQLGAIVLSSASFMISSFALFNPLTHKTNETKSDP